MIYIGCDHGGYELKLKIIKWFEKISIQFCDMGTNSTDSVDYPDIAQKVCSEILKSEENVGILICRTGIGMSMAANKFKGIRAALCHNVKLSKLSREHNNANVLALGATNLCFNKAKKIITTFLNTSFEGGRHKARVNKLNNL